MEDPRQIRIKEYDYPLPDERIAKFPLKERDCSKLLVYDQGEIKEDIFHNISKYISKDELIIFNNTRVIQARMHFNRKTGALIEVFCLEPFFPADYAENFQQTSRSEWLCMVGNLKKWKDEILEKELIIGGKTVTLRAERHEAIGTSHRVSFTWDDAGITFADILEQFGELPIPPYLNRASQESDKTTYQTVYSKIKGSVAAPTAGLHFTDRVLESLRSNGTELKEITLHVGAGTFKPVKSELIEGHEMHTEWISVSREVIEALIRHEGQCVAVGTTSVRTLESLYQIGLRIHGRQEPGEEDLKVLQWQPYETAGEAVISSKQALEAILSYMDKHGIEVLNTATQIIIAPGYTYHIVKKIVTNFHQPQSTLLLLVSAFLKGDWKRVYDYALEHDFRFLSYGDSSILIPRQS